MPVSSSETGVDSESTCDHVARSKAGNETPAQKVSPEKATLRSSQLTRRTRLPQSESSFNSSGVKCYPVSAVVSWPVYLKCVAPCNPSLCFFWVSFDPMRGLDHLRILIEKSSGIPFARQIVRVHCRNTTFHVYSQRFDLDRLLRTNEYDMRNDAAWIEVDDCMRSAVEEQKEGASSASGASSSSSCGSRPRSVSMYAAVGPGMASFPSSPSRPFPVEVEVEVESVPLPRKSFALFCGLLALTPCSYFGDDPFGNPFRGDSGHIA